MTPTQGEHAQTEALFYASALENCAEVDFDRIFVPAAAVIRRLHAQVAALTAQPAAPQGVAYAELPEPDSYLFQHDETGLTQFVDAQQVEWGFQQNNPRLRRIGGAYTADKMRDFADRTHALRASNGQAPAGATLFDEQGFRDWVLRNLPDDTIIGNSAWWADHLTAWAKRFVKAAPTAQAAPAAGAVAGPSSADELARDLKKAIETATELREQLTLSVGSQEFDLAETGTHFTTADMATACGQAFREGQAAQQAGEVALDAAMRAIQQAIGLIGEPDSDRLRAVRRVLRGAVIVVEDNAPQPSPTAQAAESVPAPAGGANWQDISTAPKDGTRFVAVGNNYGLYSEKQHTCIAQWFRGCWMEASDWSETSELKYLTHWMPLPPLPGSAEMCAKQTIEQQEIALLTDEELCQIEEPHLVNFRIPLGGQYDFARDVEKVVLAKTRGMQATTPTAQAAPAAGAVAGSAEPTQEMIAAVLRLVDLGQSDPEDHRYDDGSKLATQICRAVLATTPTPAAQADSITKERLKELLGKPETVHLNMLHGHIAVITMEQCAHLHGEEMQRKWAAADSVLEDAARIYTYKNQPGDNVIAWRFGEACRAAQPGGDLIDHGLSLLKKLQEKGYGIVAIDAAHKQGGV